jgi:hypothetical protein
LLLVLATVVLAGSPCGPLTPAAPDPAVAAVYLEVGERELAAGAPEAAAVAFSEALRRDPGSTRAQQLRDDACLALEEQALSSVETLMDARRWKDALARLATFTRAPASTRALLAGVCRFELGEDDEARRDLELAATDPRHEADARVLLALLSLRRGSACGAEAQLRALERNGALAANLAGLLRQSARGGTLALRASLFGGVDTNPSLDPAGAPPQGVLGFTGLAQWTPLGAVSPYARLAAGAREYPALASQRSESGAATLGFQLGRGGDRVAVDYSLEGSFFAGAPYAVAHGPRLEGSVSLGRVLLYGDYALRAEQFLPADAAPFSGLRHDADLGASMALPAGFFVDLGWAFTADGAQEPELAVLQHGPRLAVGWARDRTRAVLGAALDWRRWQARDPDLEVQRDDLRVRPSARVEVDLFDWLSLFVAADASVVRSNVDTLSSVRVSATGGAQLWVGLW